MRQLSVVVGCLAVVGYMAGCSVETLDADPGEKVAQPSSEEFAYAPEEADAVAAKVAPDDSLSPKGAFSRKYGSTFTTAVTIANGQTVSYQTSGGTAGVDPVLVLFRRHDNSAEFAAWPYTQRVEIQTLAINDDTNGLHSSIGYTNRSGRTENAFLMVFAYGNSTGKVTLSGIGEVDVAAGSVIASGTAGRAWTTNSNGDPWLFMFDVSPGLGNGVWNDDSNGGRESDILNATSLPMWYVAHGWNSGTTTINN